MWNSDNAWYRNLATSASTEYIKSKAPAHLLDKLLPKYGESHEHPSLAILNQTGSFFRLAYKRMGMQAVSIGLWEPICIISTNLFLSSLQCDS